MIECAYLGNPTFAEHPPSLLGNLGESQMIQTCLPHRERYDEVIERGDDPPVETLLALDEDFIGPPTAALAADSNVPILKPAKKRKTIKTVALTVHTCRWPLGDPADPDFHYCGKRPLIGRPYCDRHDARSRARSRRPATIF